MLSGIVYKLLSDDSPPTIRVKVGVGSAAYEPSGVLAVLPASTLHLDCIYPRRRGSPEWTWTGLFRQYLTGISKYILICVQLYNEAVYDQTY